MATVQLDDVYEPNTFEQLTREKSVLKNAFVKSNVMVQEPTLTNMALTGGRTGEMPAYRPVTKDEPNYSTDNPASFSTPDKISDSLQTWRLAMMNKSWSAMDFAIALALADPVDAITDQIAEYWTYVHQMRLIGSSLGILADNVANDGGDMVHNVATDDAAAPGPGELVSGETVINAAATMGDRQNEFVAMAIHSTIYTRMKLNNLIDYVEDSVAKVRFAYFQEMLLIVDDAMPAVAGTNRITYTSMLFKPGVFGMGVGRNAVPSEMERKPSSGDGGGETIIYSRDNRIIHPWGATFLSASVAGASPSFAELELAANWDRIFNRKHLGIAFMQTNG